MKKSMAGKRVAMVSNPSETKIVEGATSLHSKISKKGGNIASCLWDLIEGKKIALGYQMGIKRFNNLFIQWEDGKATEKASALPSVKDITDACRSLYLDCRAVGFMPIVRINNDGAVIVDCVQWVEDFYSERKEGGEEKPKAKKPLDIEKLLSALSEEEAATLKTLSDGIIAILKEKGAFKKVSKKVA